MGCDELEDYVTPTPKRTFTFKATIHMGGRVKPLPYDIEDDDYELLPPRTMEQLKDDYERDRAEAQNHPPIVMVFPEDSIDEVF